VYCNPCLTLPSRWGVCPASGCDAVVVLRPPCQGLQCCLDGMTECAAHGRLLGCNSRESGHHAGIYPRFVATTGLAGAAYAALHRDQAPRGPRRGLDAEREAIATGCVAVCPSPSLRKPTSRRLRICMMARCGLHCVAGGKLLCLPTGQAARHRQIVGTLFRSCQARGQPCGHSTQVHGVIRCSMRLNTPGRVASD